eukprot:6250506-Pyramimonas_sp.AAC.1
MYHVPKRGPQSSPAGLEGRSRVLCKCLGSPAYIVMMPPSGTLTVEVAWGGGGACYIVHMIGQRNALDDLWRWRTVEAETRGWARWGQNGV